MTKILAPDQINFSDDKLAFVDHEDGQVVEMQHVSRIWYRMRSAGEGTTSYRYFKFYLMMNQPRKLGKLARHLRVSESNLRKYSSDFDWLERAAAFDDYHSEQELTKLRQKQELAERVWADRRNEQREIEWQFAQELLDKVRQMLQVPLFSYTVTETLKDLDQNGRIIVEQIVNVAPLDWGAVDMARFFEVASKMARLATGMDTDQKKVRLDISALTDDELERIAASR